LVLAILDPAIEHVLSQGLYRDLVDCLELLSFSDDPAGDIARSKKSRINSSMAVSIPRRGNSYGVHTIGSGGTLLS
jgi:hypothetical protein